MNQFVAIRSLCLLSAAFLHVATAHADNTRAEQDDEVGVLASLSNYGVFRVPDDIDDALIDSSNLWRVQGSIGVSFQTVDIDGDATRSPLRFDGSHSFTDFELRATRETQRGRVHAELAGLVNDSQYRSPQDGLIIEKGFFEWEHAGDRVSSWLRSGDLFASLSPRTLQRPLKGVLAEVQSDIGWLDGEHSFQLLSGVQSPNFDDLSRDDGWFNAASSLWTRANSAVIFNYLRYSDNLQDRTNREEIWSLGFDHAHQFGDHSSFAVEGEFGHLTTNQELSNNLSDTSADGIYLSANAQLFRGLTIAATYEDYDLGYSPRGGAIRNDRRTRTTRLNWTPSPALRLSVRAQEFIDDRSTPNQTTNQVVGARITTRLSMFNRPIELSLDAFSRERFDSLASIDNVSDNLDVELSFNTAGNFQHLVNLVYLENQDSRQQQNSEAIELGYQLGKPFRWRDWQGYSRLGLIYRDIDNTRPFLQSRSDELGLTLNAKLQKGNIIHELFLSSLDQDRDQNNLEDFRRNNYGYRLQYDKGQHQFELQLRQFLNRPNRGLDVDTQQLSLVYRYFFDRTLGAQSLDAGYKALPISTLLTAIKPGLNAQDLSQIFNDYGLGSVTKLGDHEVIRHDVWPSLGGDQRVVVRRNAVGDLLESGVIVDFDFAEDEHSSEEQFKRLRAQLIRELGQPSFSDLAVNLNDFSQTQPSAEPTLRLEEWRFKESTIVLRVPNRLDSRLRMEVLHFPSGFSQNNRRPSWEAIP